MHALALRALGSHFVALGGGGLAGEISCADDIEQEQENQGATRMLFRWYRNCHIYVRRERFFFDPPGVIEDRPEGSYRETG